MQTFYNMFKDKSQLFDRFFFICLLCVVVSLPFATLFNSYCIILLAVSWFLQGSLQEKFNRLLTNKLALAYIGFYFLHIAGLLYTTNIKAGMSDVETKLALLAFPLILSTARPLTKKQIQLVLTWFVATCIVAITICFVHAIYQYIVYHTSEYFYYHQLGSAIKIHAIYLAMYLNFAMAIIVYILATQWKILSMVTRYLLFILITYLFVGVIFLSSKIVILSIFLLLNIFIARLLWVKKGLVFSIILVALLNTIGIIVLTSIPYTKERLVSELDFNFDFMEKNEYDRPYTGFVLRVVMWKFSIDILNAEKQWLFGVGTGDGQDFLDQSYRDHHMYTGNFYLNDKGHLGYNTHNQYMQFLLSLGIVGLTYFLLLLAITFFLAFRHKKYLYLYFLFLFSISATTESNLCTQKGVVFYGLFNSLFLFHSLQEEKRSKVIIDNYI
jgi:O-antigen ligase